MSILIGVSSYDPGDCCICGVTFNEISERVEKGRKLVQPLEIEHAVAILVGVSSHDPGGCGICDVTFSKLLYHWLCRGPDDDDESLTFPPVHGIRPLPSFGPDISRTNLACTGGSLTAAL